MVHGHDLPLIGLETDRSMHQNYWLLALFIVSISISSLAVAIARRTSISYMTSHAVGCCVDMPSTKGHNFPLSDGMPEAAFQEAASTASTKGVFGTPNNQP